LVPVAPRRQGDGPVIRSHLVAAHRAAVVATVASLLFDAGGLIALSLEIANGWVPLGEPGVSQTIMSVVLFALAFPLLGWIILRRDPSNRLGWIYLAIGFWQAVNMFATGYSTVAYWVASGTLPLASEL